MSENNEVKQDLRVTKTYRNLQNALLEALKKETFEKITVNDLCEQAFVSRATFYSHFEDKYSLLRFCLNEVKEKLHKEAEQDGEQTLFNKLIEHIYDNPKIYKNLIMDEGSSELTYMLNDLLVKNLVKIISEKNNNHVPADVLAPFFAGGLTNLLIWLLRGNFPVDRETMKVYVSQMYDILYNKTLK